MTSDEKVGRREVGWLGMSIFLVHVLASCAAASEESPPSASARSAGATSSRASAPQAAPLRSSEQRLVEVEPDRTGEFQGRWFHVRIPGVGDIAEKQSGGAPPDVQLFTARSKLAPAHVFDFGSVSHLPRRPADAFSEIAKAMTLGRDLGGGDCLLESPPTPTGQSNGLKLYRWSLRCPSRNTVSRVTGLVGRNHLFLTTATAAASAPPDAGVYEEIVSSFVAID